MAVALSGLVALALAGAPQVAQAAPAAPAAPVALPPAPPAPVAPPAAPAAHAAGGAAVSFGAFFPRAFDDPMFAMATRVGWAVLPGVQLGGMLDWHHAAFRSVSFPDGTALGRGELDEFPLLAYAELGRAGTSDLLPYAGLAGGYDPCFVAPYGGETDLLGRWTWQVWAGIAAGLLGPRGPAPVTIGVEALYQVARPAGSVHDATGSRRREVLDTSGLGVRVTLAMEY